MFRKLWLPWTSQKPQPEESVDPKATPAPVKEQFSQPHQTSHPIEDGASWTNSQSWDRGDPFHEPISTFTAQSAFSPHQPRLPQPALAETRVRSAFVSSKKPSVSAQPEPRQKTKRYFVEEFDEEDEDEVRKPKRRRIFYELVEVPATAQLMGLIPKEKGKKRKYDDTLDEPSEPSSKRHKPRSSQKREKAKTHQTESPPRRFQPEILGQSDASFLERTHASPDDPFRSPQFERNLSAPHDSQLETTEDLPTPSRIIRPKFDTKLRREPQPLRETFPHFFQSKKSVESPATKESTQLAPPNVAENLSSKLAQPNTSESKETAEPKASLPIEPSETTTQTSIPTPFSFKFTDEPQKQDIQNKPSEEPQIDVTQSPSTDKETLFPKFDSSNTLPQLSFPSKNSEPTPLKEDKESGPLKTTEGLFSLASSNPLPESKEETEPKTSTPDITKISAMPIFGASVPTFNFNLPGAAQKQDKSDTEENLKESKEQTSKADSAKLPFSFGFPDTKSPPKPQTSFTFGFSDKSPTSATDSSQPKTAFSFGGGEAKLDFKSIPSFTFNSPATSELTEPTTIDKERTKPATQLKEPEDATKETAKEQEKPKESNTTQPQDEPAQATEQQEKPKEVSTEEKPKETSTKEEKPKETSVELPKPETTQQDKPKEFNKEQAMPKSFRSIEITTSAKLPDTGEQEPKFTVFNFDKETQKLPAEKDKPLFSGFTFGAGTTNTVEKQEPKIISFGETETTEKTDFGFKPSSQPKEQSESTAEKDKPLSPRLTFGVPATDEKQEPSESTAEKTNPFSSPFALGAPTTPKAKPFSSQFTFGMLTTDAGEKQEPKIPTFNFGEPGTTKKTELSFNFGEETQKLPAETNKPPSLQFTFPPPSLTDTKQPFSLSTLGQIPKPAEQSDSKVATFSLDPGTPWSKTPTEPIKTSPSFEYNPALSILPSSSGPMQPQGPASVFVFGNAGVTPPKEEPPQFPVSAPMATTPFSSFQPNQSPQPFQYTFGSSFQQPNFSNPPVGTNFSFGTSEGFQSNFAPQQQQVGGSSFDFSVGQQGSSTTSQSTRPTSRGGGRLAKGKPTKK